MAEHEAGHEWKKNIVIALAAGYAVARAVFFFTGSLFGEARGLLGMIFLGAGESLGAVLVGVPTVALLVKVGLALGQTGVDLRCVRNSVLLATAAGTAAAEE
jgi:hypothetical protein